MTSLRSSTAKWRLPEGRVESRVTSSKQRERSAVDWEPGLEQPCTVTLKSIKTGNKLRYIFIILVFAFNDMSLKPREHFVYVN